MAMTPTTHPIQKRHGGLSPGAQRRDDRRRGGRQADDDGGVSGRRPLQSERDEERVADGQTKSCPQNARQLAEHRQARAARHGESHHAENRGDLDATAG
jgi:hypothetical protein